MGSLWKEPEEDQAVAMPCPADTPSNLDKTDQRDQDEVKRQAKRVRQLTVGSHDRREWCHRVAGVPVAPLLAITG